MGTLSVGPLRDVNGVMITDSKAMADTFVNSFASVFTLSVPPAPAPHQVFDGHMDDIIFSLDHIHDSISKLDPSSAMGPDAIHPHLLKACVSVLAFPLLLLFRKSYDTRELTLDWTKSWVLPIFKKGSRHDPLMYRPVSLTSTCVKTMERILVKFIYDYAQSNNLLNEDQFGFRPGRSTEDQLILTYHQVTSWLDQGFNVDLILFDFSKAFDTVCHSVLLDKLFSLGIRGRLLYWIKAFLVNRNMCVSVSNQHSHPREVLSGVPQGSVLGPLLFLIYVNYVTHNLTSSVKIFADDLKLYVCTSPSPGPCLLRDITSCQRDINTSNLGTSNELLQVCIVKISKKIS